MLLFLLIYMTLEEYIYQQTIIMFVKVQIIMNGKMVVLT